MIQLEHIKEAVKSWFETSGWLLWFLFMVIISLPSVIFITLFFFSVTIGLILVLPILPIYWLGYWCGYYKISYLKLWKDTGSEYIGAIMELKKHMEN
jgi:hypothetical protein